MISLIYGENFYVFEPATKPSDEAYEIDILIRHNQFFGPFPICWGEIADESRIEAAIFIMDNTPKGTMKPFRKITNREISEADKDFVLKMMRIDWRTRATVTELLADEWFVERLMVEEDVPSFANV